MRLFSMKLHGSHTTNFHAKGFSLLEILIAVLILSIGLLGLAALHASSLKANHGAYHKSQATYLAYDIVDCMRANRPEVINGTYNQLLTSGIRATVNTLADADVNDWLTNVAGLLPGGDGAINCDAAGFCTVTVIWDIQREGGTAIPVGGGGSTTTQTFIFRTDV